MKRWHRPPDKDERGWLPAMGKYESTPQESAMRAAAMSNHGDALGYDEQPETGEQGRRGKI